MGHRYKIHCDEAKNSVWWILVQKVILNTTSWICGLNINDYTCGIVIACVYDLSEQ